MALAVGMEYGGPHATPSAAVAILGSTCVGSTSCWQEAAMQDLVDRAFRAYYRYPGPELRAVVD